MKPQRSWAPLDPRALVSSAITYEPKINSRTVQGERTRAGFWQDNGAADGGMDTLGEAQWGSGRIVNGMIILVGQPDQVQVTAELRADASAHGLWKRGITAMFDIQIVNLGAGSYLRMMPEEALEKAEKENKDLYLQACLERIRNFTRMVYSTDRILIAEDLAYQKWLSALLSCKLKREYSEMCGFMRARMSIVMVRSDILLLRGPRDKGACICQRTELTDGAVMALLAPWRG